MKFKKFLLASLALLAGLVLVACGSSAKDQQAAIKEKGKLVVALSPDYAPFEFRALVDGKDKIVGSDIELAQAIADELGVELELSAMSFDNVLSSLQSGKADIAISALSYTEERAKVYDFSDAYYETENAILVAKKEKDTYNSLESLAGKRIGVQKGTIEEGLAKDQLKDSNIVALKSMSQAINELKSGQVQAVVLEKPIAEGYLAQNDDLELANYALTVSEGDAKAIAMPKDSGELRETINKVIANLEKDNKYHQFISEAAELTRNAISSEEE